MIALLQRVKEASVTVDGKIVGQIKQGILLFLGLEKEDSWQNADRLLEKILKYRLFSDEQGKMNLSVQDIDGEILLVSQFTLAADTAKGNRASFSSAMPPDKAKAFYEEICTKMQSLHPKIAFGQFGADMQVALINDGPVTFSLKG